MSSKPVPRSLCVSRAEATPKQSESRVMLTIIPPHRQASTHAWRRESVRAPTDEEATQLAEAEARLTNAKHAKEETEAISPRTAQDLRTLHRIAADIATQQPADRRLRRLSLVWR